MAITLSPIISKAESCRVQFNLIPSNKETKRRVFNKGFRKNLHLTYIPSVPNMYKHDRGKVIEYNLVEEQGTKIFPNDK